MTDNLPPLPPCAPEFKPRWPNDPGGYTAEQMQAYARAAIERQSVPAGWMLVPIEPSDEWIARLESQQTGELEAVDADAIRQCIVELLAAAPQPQQVQEPVKGWWAHTCPEDGKVDVVNYQLTPADKRAGWVEHEVYTSPQAKPQPAKPLTEEQERADFEPVAKREGCVDFRRVGDGYADRRTLRCWRVWQAAHGITKGTK